MRTFSLIYMAVCLAFQTAFMLGIPFGNKWANLGFLALPLMFAIHGFWSIYLSGNAKNVRRKVIFWWLIGFVPISIFLGVGVTSADGNGLLGSFFTLSGFAFFAAVIRIIWIGADALTRLEREKFGKEKWPTFLTGIAIYFPIPGMFFLYNRKKALDG